jgi:replicative DNA helicase
MNLEEISPYDAEAAFLGTLLVDGYEVWNYSKNIKSYMFAQLANRAIYEAIMESANLGMEPNALVTHDILKNKGLIDRVGGKAYLDALVDRRQPPKNLPHLVTKIQNSYKVNELKRINAQIPDMVMAEGHVNEVISKIHQELNNLVNEVGSPDVSKVGEDAEEALQKILHRRENPGIRGLSTGIKEIDFQTGGFNEGDVWYIGARPSHGKSAWLIKTGMRVAQQGYGFLIFNREMQKQDIHDRIFSIISKVPLQDIRLGFVKDKDIPKLERAKETVEGLDIYVDNNFQGGIDYIVATIRKYHQLYNIRVVGVDYIQLIVDRTSESVHLLGNASRQLKLLANELGITIIILSQMNREVEKREDKRPLMADLRQSGNLEEDADIMVALYRDEMYIDNSPQQGKMEFLIRKSRNGPTGMLLLDFDKETVNITYGMDDAWNKEDFI